MINNQDILNYVFLVASTKARIENQSPMSADKIKALTELIILYVKANINSNQIQLNAKMHSINNDYCKFVNQFNLANRTDNHPFVKDNVAASYTKVNKNQDLRKVIQFVLFNFTNSSLKYIQSKLI